MADKLIIISADAELLSQLQPAIEKSSLPDVVSVVEHYPVMGRVYMFFLFSQELDIKKLKGLHTKFLLTRFGMSSSLRVLLETFRRNQLVRSLLGRKYCLTNLSPHLSPKIYNVSRVIQIGSK